MSFEMRIELDKWTPERLAKWEKTLGKGKKRFVWAEGVGGYGGGMFLGRMIADALGGLRGNHMPFAVSLGINLLIWPLAGYFFGLWMWAWNEKSYQRAVKNAGS